MGYISRDTSPIIGHIILEIILIKTRKVERHIKGYHAYMNELTPEIGEILKTCLEPENVVDRFAVAVEKEGQITGHLNKGKSGRFAKTIFSFLRAKQGNTCQVEVRRKKVNLGDEQGLQVYCSVLRRRKVYKNIKKQFTVLASIFYCEILN